MAVLQNPMVSHSFCFICETLINRPRDEYGTDTDGYIQIRIHIFVFYLDLDLDTNSVKCAGY